MQPCQFLLPKKTKKRLASHCFTGTCFALLQLPHTKCPNISAPGHPEKIMSDLSTLRNCLIKSIVGLSNVRVADLCVVTNCAPTANTNTQLDLLRNVCASDGVHFTAVGYTNMATNDVTCLAATPQHAIGPKK
jgi:hypothetical protein